MASEDKTYCGEAERDQPANVDEKEIAELANKLGVSGQDIVDIIALVGHDRQRIESYFHDKENSY
ncbi:MAG TPA: hypothetical protein VK618_00980 [Flavitalea sp.]|nr:hypothetical protein [Flavitalea sp.]